MYSHYPDQSEYDDRHKEKMRYLSLTRQAGTAIIT